MKTHETAQNVLFFFTFFGGGIVFYVSVRVCCQVMGVVGPSSVADGLPLLHLSPYLSPPLPFSTAVVRLVALQIQVGLNNPEKNYTKQTANNNY